MPRSLLKATILLTLVPLATLNAQVKKPNLDVQLLPAVKGVAPGQPFEVALQIKLPEGWHAYWKNSGDSGQPPKVQWRLPEGFGVSELQFPVPRRYAGAAGMTFNIHEDELVLLATVSPPQTLQAGSQIELAADLQVLVCQKACVMVRSSVSAKLAALASGSKPEVAHEDVFLGARYQLPKSPDEAKYARIKSLASVDRVRPGDRFELAVVLDVMRGMHIQSDKPLNEFLIATDVFRERTEGVYFGPLQFPKAKIKTQGKNKISEFDGQVVIRFSAEADETLPAGNLDFTGVTRFQACNEQGRCFPPQNIQWSQSVPTAAAGSAVKQLHADIFVATAAQPEGEPDLKITAIDTAPQAPQAPADAMKKLNLPGKTGLPKTVPTPAVTQDNAVADGAPTDSTDSASRTPVPTPDDTATAQQGGLLWNMLLAALGGLILNIMPCVLPVISIKILSFMQQAGEHPRRVFALGLVFCSGIMVSFATLAAVVIVLQQGSQRVGWGFHLADPVTVVVLSTVMFVFGLSLFGVFEVVLPGGASSRLGQVEAREGLPGAFFKGVLATVLAIPCTAPFMAPAVAFAFQDGSATTVFAIMLAMGFGMAFPYVLLTANPAWMKYLPKPGAWMERFKQFMGFLLMGTVVWLMIILGRLTGPFGVGGALAFFCFVGLGVWVFGISQYSPSKGRQWASMLACALIMLLGGAWSFGSLGSLEIVDSNPASARRPELVGLDYSADIPWQGWSAGLPKRLAADGHTVFVDYTAVWCATCQTNKKLVLETDPVRSKMDELNIIPIKADYTAQPDDMTRELNAYGSAGVPLNVILPAGRPDEPILLPPQLVGQRQLVLDKLDEAGPSNQKVALHEPRP